MSIDTIEKSIAGRIPVRLYTFKLGVVRWDYNSSAEDIKRGAITYKALKGGMSDSGIIISDGGISDNFKITAPATIEIARLFNNTPPSSRLTLEVANTHLHSDETIPVWWGVVISVTDKTAATIEILASPNETLANRPGVTLIYSRQCGAIIYDSQCKVNKELYRVRTTVQQVEVSALMVSDAAKYQDGWFDGGFIEFTDANNDLARRYIEAHAGSTLTLWGSTQGISQGMSISLFAGCNSAANTCANKFNNQLNRQAFDHLQGYSPFDGNQVF